MKITEFFDALKGINFDDEYDYLSVHFAGNYVGSIRDVKVVSNKIVLSAEYDPNGFTLGFFDLYSKVKKLAESADTYDYDVVYSVPSKGTYNVEGVKKNHYDYSDDGDGVYDRCDIYCSDEAVSGGTDDDIKSHNLNPDDYEDFFEDLLNLENQPMNETIDGKYAAACYRAERVLASFYKDFGKEMTRMAFEHELDDIDF